MAILKRVTAKNVIFYDANLTGANVCQAEFLGSVFNGAILEGVRNAETANFFGTSTPPGKDPSPTTPNQDLSDLNSAH
mgnify:CR=1 FL=1